MHRSYDPNGNLAWASQPVASADPAQVAVAERSSFSYFDTGWIKTSTDPAIPTVQFDYTAEGQQAWRAPTLPDGALDLAQRMLWSYDADGRLVELKDEGGQGTSYAYDANGNLASASDVSGVASASESALSVTAAYDGFDQLVKARHKKRADGSWTATSYAYDLGGNVTERTDNQTEDGSGNLSGGRRSTFAYDEVGRLLQQLDGGLDAGAADDLRTSWAYFANGLSSSKTTAGIRSSTPTTTKSTTPSTSHG